jgi:hypothetical protein
MTNEELDAIEARAKAATKGPWTSVDSCYLCGGVHVDGSENNPVEHGGGYATKEDLSFIAHARSDVPALVAEVRRLQALLDSDDQATAVLLRRYDEFSEWLLAAKGDDE